jgi:hypothetical protein
MAPKTEVKQSSSPAIKPKAPTVLDDRLQRSKTATLAGVTPGGMREKLAAFFQIAAPLILFALGWAFKTGRMVYKVYCGLPHNIIMMMSGLVLCFFGGTYFATIAAVEAFRQFGGDDLLRHLKLILDDVEIAVKAVQDDAAAKKDKDKGEEGKVDAGHLAFVVMKSVKEPEKLQLAVRYFLTTWMAVKISLRSKFAQTIALCLKISDTLELPACRIFGPLLSATLGKDLEMWSHTIISTTIKIIAVWVATYVQSVISSVYSSIHGATLFATGLINLLGEHFHHLPYVKLTKDPTDGKEKFDADNSWLDEIIGWPLAALGCYWQFMNNYALPFPFNLVLWPMALVEWFVRWEVFVADQ